MSQARSFGSLTGPTVEGVFSGQIRVALIGCGHAGVPIAVALSKAGAAVCGFDTSVARVRALSSGCDDHFAADELAGICWTNDPSMLHEVRCFVVVVPTPSMTGTTGSVDLSCLLAATEQVGKVLKHGDAVIFESTVYPGCTEENCAPVLEKVSGLSRGGDFHLCFAPERINPGDKTRGLADIVRVVSGCDASSLNFADALYSRVTPAGIHRAASLRVAEAAKLSENVRLATHPPTPNTAPQHDRSSI